MFLNDIYNFLKQDSGEIENDFQEKSRENFNLLENNKFLESEKNLQILENITNESKHKKLQVEEKDEIYPLEVDKEKSSSRNSLNIFDSNTQVCSSNDNKNTKNDKDFPNLDSNSNLKNNPIIIDLEKLENLESCENFEILLNHKKDSKSNSLSNFQSNCFSNDENLENLESIENTVSVSLHSTPNKSETYESSQKMKMSLYIKEEAVLNKEEQKNFIVDSDPEKYDKNSQNKNYFSKSTNSNGNLIITKSKKLIQSSTPVKYSNFKNNNLLSLVKSSSILNNSIASKDIYKTKLDDIISKIESKLSQIKQKNTNLFSHLNSKINIYKNYFPSNLKIDTNLIKTKKEVLKNTYLISQEKEKYFKLVKDKQEDQKKNIMSELNLSCGGKVPIIKSYKEEVELEIKENQIRESQEEIHPTCKVCNNADYEDQDLFIFCVECNISIHACCYGVSLPFPIEDFVCDVCKKFSLSDGENLECLLCPVKGGAMKKCILKPNTSYLNNILSMKRGEIYDKKNDSVMKNLKLGKISQSPQNENINKNHQISKKCPKKSAKLNNNEKISNLNFDSPISLKSDSIAEDPEQPDRRGISDLTNLSLKTNTKITTPNSHTFTFSIFNSTQNCSNISNTSQTSLENNITFQGCKNHPEYQSIIPSNNQSRGSVNNSEENNLEELSNFSLNEQEIENINDIVNNSSSVSHSDTKSEKNNINFNNKSHFIQSLEGRDLLEDLNINSQIYNSSESVNCQKMTINRPKCSKAPHKNYSFNTNKSGLNKISTCIKQPKSSKYKNSPLESLSNIGKISSTANTQVPQSKNSYCKSQAEAWVHLSCALWNPEVDIGDFYHKSEIRNIENLDKSRFKELCSICKLTNQGPTLKCSATNCNSASICTTRFHVECARINKFSFETLNIKGTLQYNIYCQKHQQNKFIKLLETRKLKVLDDIIEYRNILSKIYINHEREYESNPLDFHKSILYSGEGNVQSNFTNNLKSSNNSCSNLKSKNSKNSGKKIKLCAKEKLGQIGKQKYKDTSIKNYAINSKNSTTKNKNSYSNKNTLECFDPLNPNEINYALVASKMGLQERCNFLLKFKHLCKLYSNPNSIVLKKIKILPGSENFKANPLIQSLYPPVINLELMADNHPLSHSQSQNGSNCKSTRSSLNPAPHPQFKYEFDTNTFKNKLKFEDIVKCKNFPWDKVSYKNFTTKQVKNLFFAIVPDEITYNRRILKRKNKHKNILIPEADKGVQVATGESKPHIQGNVKTCSREDMEKKKTFNIKEKGQEKINLFEKKKNGTAINLIGTDDMIIDLIDADIQNEKEISYLEKKLDSRNENEYEKINNLLSSSHSQDEKNQSCEEAATVAVNSNENLDDVDMDVDYNEEFNFEPEEEGIPEIYCYCKSIDDGSIMISKKRIYHLLFHFLYFRLQV